MILARRGWGVVAAWAMVAVSGVPGMASAQEAAAVAPPPPLAEGMVAEPDADRLAAANRLVATLSPEAREAARVEAQLRPLFDALLQNLTNRDGVQDALRAEPRAAAIFQRFTRRVRERAIDATIQELPRVRIATARAYARLFTVDQMEEMNRLFSTPAGQTYLDNVSAITSDPDIQRVQGEVAQRVERSLQPLLQDLAKELEALAPKR